jgi:hypothetical protein
MNTYWLNVPHEEADKAKALRCKWDADKRRWWKPSNVSIMAIPKDWISPDVFDSWKKKGIKGRRASVKATSKGLIDMESRIAYPSIKCTQEQLNLSYKQVKELIASGRFKQIRT